MKVYFSLPLFQAAFSQGYIYHSKGLPFKERFENLGPSGLPEQILDRKYPLGYSSPMTTSSWYDIDLFERWRLNVFAYRLSEMEKTLLPAAKKRGFVEKGLVAI